MTFEAIPYSLRRVPQWIVYRLRKNGEKTDKLPVDHRTGKVHDAHDREIWMGFDEAVEAAAGADGIGFVFTAEDPFSGIDLDRCLSADGALEPWAEQIVDCLQSYSEASISGTGVHIIIRGFLPDGYGHKVNGQGAEGKGAVEVYDRRRFFAFSGRWLDRSPKEAMDRQEEFEAFCRARLPLKGRPRDDEGAGARAESEASPVEMSDDDVVQMARKIWPVDRFRELFDEANIAGYGGDWSRADMALCNFLAFWTGKRADQIDRIFRASSLMRDKWDEKRGGTTYGKLTIEKVLRTTTASYSAAVEPEERGGEGVKADRSAPWDPMALDDAAPAAEFPLHVFPSDLSDFLEAGASCLTCPVDFLAVAALVVAGAAIGRSVAVRVKESWVETAAIYAALVAKPGSTKSPALSLVARPLWSIAEELLDEFRREVAEASKEDPRPVLRRIVVGDATREALAPILVDNPRGIAMVRDELTAWVTGMDQYKTGGKGSDRQFFLEAWAGATVTVDRKGQHERGPLHIPHPFLSVLGALTPDMISALSEEKARNDGFIDRMLFAMPDPVRVRWNDDVIPRMLSDRWHAAVRSLFARRMVQEGERPRPFFVWLGTDAKEAYTAWYDAHQAESEAEDFPPHLEGPWAKMRAYCARLALILDRLGRAYCPILDGTPPEVSASSMHGATALADYFKSHCRRVRGLIGSDNPDARAVLRWVRSTGRRAFNVRDVKQNFRARFAHDPDAAADALRWLESRSCIRPLETPGKSGPGRPPSPAFEVNPAVFRGADGEF